MTHTDSTEQVKKVEKEHDFVETRPMDRVDVLLAGLVADGLANTQIFKYSPPGGHGFAAEDANHFADLFRGNRAQVVGTADTKNGPDRAVNGTLLQTKYHSTPAKTVEAAFEYSWGGYRYEGQLLEVPKDQYAECVKLMQNRIRRGQVPGVRNPAEAENIVVSGSVTYEQAKNIARAGNVDSLFFDAKTQSITSLSVFGISFVVTFAQSRWRGEDFETAARAAFESALITGGMAWITGVASAQVLRTQVGSLGASAIKEGVEAIAQTPVGGAVVRQIAAGSLRRSVNSATAVPQVVRILRANAVTATVAAVVISSPDFYRAAIQRSISWKQFTKNLSVNAVGVAAGTAGWLGGSAAGAALGSAVPVVGTAAGAVIGGVAGSLGAGIGGAVAAKSIADKITPDDSERLIKILQDELARLASAYILTEVEFEQTLARITKRVDAKWLRLMYQQSHKRDFIRIEFEHLFREKLRIREKVDMPSAEDLEKVADSEARKSA